MITHNILSFRVKYQPGIDFVDALLVCDPRKRPSATDALDHSFFWDDIKPCKPAESVHCIITSLYFIMVAIRIRKFQSSHEFNTRRKEPMAKFKFDDVDIIRLPAHPLAPAAYVYCITSKPLTDM